MTEWLSSIGPAVGNHLWQSTAFAAVVWLATLLLRRNQARVRYGLWFAASAKFLIPFSLLVGLGSLLPRPQHVVVAMPISYAMDTVAQPFTEMPMDIAPVVAQASPMQRFEHMVPLALGIIWLCGMLVVLAVWGTRWRQVAKTLRRAVRVEDGREWEILRQLHKPMGAGRQLPLLMSQKLMEPGMFGIFRPVLIWPERLSERLDDEHIEAILAHELRHAQRRDNLTAVFHMVVEAAFWFHPLVWWMERRMVEERERACDEAVVEMGSRPGIYAESLLKACRFCVESPLVCVSGITGADLSKRVLSIMTLRLERMSMARKVTLALFGLIVIATPILLGQSEAAQRVITVALQSAPAPIRAVAHAMIAEEQTPSTGLIAEAQVPMETAVVQPGDEQLGPAFEVASIRPANPSDGRQGRGIGVDASGRFTASGASLSALVWLAYVRAPGSGKVSGGPMWGQSDWFDINAKVDDAYVVGWDKLTDAQRMDRVRPMIRRLLSERFQLKLRIEMQPTPVYALVQAKGGTKMKEVPTPDPIEGDPKEALARQINRGKPVPGNVKCWGTTCTGLAVPMSNAIGYIVGMSHADRMVIDETGLKGYYNFTFTQPRNNDDSAMAEVEGDLGLMFDPRTVPMKAYVIDSAEKPSVDGAEVTPAVLQNLEANAAPVSTWIPLVNEEGIATPEAAAVIPIKFDIVSFKACKEGVGSGTVVLPLDGDFIEYKCQPIGRILYFAFSGPHPFMMKGEPGWVDNDRYDFQAKVAPADIATWQELDLSAKRLMVQALLEDLLKVKVRPDLTPHPVYDLVVAKGGPKFKPFQEGESNTLPNGKVLVGRTSYWDPDGTNTIQGITIGALAETISTRVGRQVIDKTGLTGLYDVSLYIPNEHYNTSQADAGDSPIPHIFDGVKALGLELQPSKGPTYGLVMDHIERPPDN